MYPDTYKMNVNFKINEFVIKQLDTFEVKVYDKILQKYDVGTINDIINLASIVEKEEKNPQEKPIVA
ncbi:MAG: endolytic transglycosylase MltG [Candidatus Peribacteria bacterium]|nr:endolytic transglycosylase MltG [Candidatus Peribacteria bacterium]